MCVHRWTANSSGSKNLLHLGEPGAVLGADPVELRARVARVELVHGLEHARRHVVSRAHLLGRDDAKALAVALGAPTIASSTSRIATTVLPRHERVLVELDVKVLFDLDTQSSSSHL